ncbi:hypothetical protein GPJ56_001800 [Histomonas meleagridis]|uniref:uncharacterized protein n=1 Tax=Histomonas meleagridis TaxID=135588 RepID=UPI00355A0AA8|nr:hypothetical protein GPJ56_001800 [Histomonas meleagridis]KAH0803263.1 hypothetical protein GO595_003999 [Histomonas meleagridis]
MYVSKSNGSVRQKIVQIFLNRYPNSSGTPKVYGRLSLDISRYFDSKTTIKKEVEMESSRSIAPILSISFTFQNENNSKASPVDKNDVSFTEEKPQQVDLLAWDQTDTEDQSANSIHGLNTHATQADDTSTSSKRSHKRRRHKRSPHADTDSNVTAEEVPSKTSPEQEPTPEPEQEHEIINEEPQKEEEEEKKEIIEEITKKKKSNITKYIKLISSVLKHEWVEAPNPNYIDSTHNCPYPPAVFPIYSTILEAKLLRKDKYDEKEFSKLFNCFFDNYSEIPIKTKDTKFLTTLMLTLLITYNENHNENNDEERAKMFCDKLVNILDEDSKSLVTPLLRNFNGMINRFSTANFDVYHLIDDFRQVINNIKSAFNFTNGINDYLLLELITLLDARMSNKIISNPLRFTFTHAITWNSFVTAFEAHFNYSLNYLRQIVNIIIMVPNIINSSPEDNMIGADEQSLCPNIDLANVAYIIENFKKDEMFDDEIDIENFFQKFHLNKTEEFSQIFPEKVKNIEKTKENARIELWNRKSTQTDVAVKTLKFLNKYVYNEDE